MWREGWKVDAAGMAFKEDLLIVKVGKMYHDFVVLLNLHIFTNKIWFQINGQQ